MSHSNLVPDKRRAERVWVQSLNHPAVYGIPLVCLFILRTRFVLKFRKLLARTWARVVQTSVQLYFHKRPQFAKIVSCVDVDILY